MKSITLLIFLFSFNLYAQFPAPYCDIDPMGTTVEEITSVSFAEIDITNTDSSSILVDATENIGFMNQGDSYSFTVTGNTYGDFENDIVAFIDWNNNGILDDENEIHLIGTILNSNGSDGISVSLDIEAPIDVEFITELRVRVTKTYKDADSPAEIDPCAIAFNPFGQGVFPGFGQALDFKIIVGLIGVDEFDINKLSIYPQPANDILNIDYIEEIALLEVYNMLGQQLISAKESSSRVKLNVSSLKAGAYFLKLHTASNKHVVKIIKG